MEGSFGGWPILEDNLGGKFNADNFDMTELMTGLFVHAGSTSILRPTVQYHEGTDKYQLEVGVNAIIYLIAILYRVL